MNLDSGNWSGIESGGLWPAARKKGQMFAIGSKLYLFGGYSSDDSFIREFSCYDQSKEMGFDL